MEENSGSANKFEQLMDCARTANNSATLTICGRAMGGKAPASSLGRRQMHEKENATASEQMGAPHGSPNPHLTRSVPGSGAGVGVG